MSLDFFLSWQFGMTLLAALAIGVWQFYLIRRSRARRGELSSQRAQGPGSSPRVPPT
jgi:hypothetical protein